jgi:hypothetical protein
VKEDEICRACSTNREKRNACRILIGKPEAKRPIRRPRYRLIDNIKMDLIEIGLGDLDRIGLAEDRDRLRAVLSTMMKLRFELIAGNFLSGSAASQEGPFAMLPYSQKRNPP